MLKGGREKVEGTAQEKRKKRKSGRKGSTVRRLKEKPKERMGEQK